MAIDVYKQWLGIPEEFRPPTHYHLLRLVDFEDDPDKIRAHYKKLNTVVRKYASGDFMLQSQDLLNELAKAMLCLTDAGRKREYDESLGREFDQGETSGSKPMLQVLCTWGDIDKSQIKEVEEFADKRGLSQRDACVQMKLVSAEKAAMAYAQELEHSFVDLETVLPDDTVLDMVPKNVVKRNRVLPLFIDEDVVLVACVDMPDHELEDEFRLRFNKPMRSVIATPLQINQAIAKFYAPGERDKAVAQNVSPGKRAKSGSKSKNKAADKPQESLTEDEKNSQRSMAILFLCWSVIGSALVDQLIIKAYILPRWSFFVGFVLIIPPITFFLIKDKLLKK
ncbi:MAG: general secretion pathway protein GspE [Planctomycetaceae bacterium]|nr:general secretion pathway protein GspE [Planctomycetaceae bacterium]